MKRMVRGFVQILSLASGKGSITCRLCTGEKFLSINSKTRKLAKYSAQWVPVCLACSLSSSLPRKLPAFVCSFPTSPRRSKGFRADSRCHKFSISSPAIVQLSRLLPVELQLRSHHCPTANLWRVAEDPVARVLVSEGSDRHEEAPNIGRMGREDWSRFPSCLSVSNFTANADVHGSEASFFLNAVWRCLAFLHELGLDTLHFSALIYPRNLTGLGQGWQSEQKLACAEPGNSRHIDENVGLILT